jgi:1-acyl-sn-glycerol-3-phosphate acyltransferase
LRTLHARLGTIPSTREAMLEALRAGVPLLVFPGGDHEAFRPVWEAGRVDFGGRIGFARIAHEAGVEIYPLAISGGAWTAPMLWRSTWLLPRMWVLPWLTGVKRWPLSLLGLVGAAGIACGLETPWRWALAAAWAASPLSLVPWIPASITMRVGEPIAPEPDARASAARVESELQRLVAERPR